MNWLLLVFVLVVPLLITWTSIHEFSHFLMAKLVMNAKLVKVRVFPFTDPVAGFRWGAVWYDFGGKVPTPGQSALISFAPRIADVVAAVALPCGGLLVHAPDLVFVLWTAFWGAGLFDLGNGSMGVSPYSDLQEGATALKRSPWGFRLAGLAVIIYSVVTWLFVAGPHALKLW